MPFEDVLDIYMLSPLQQGILFHCIATPEPGVYVEQLAFDLMGELDPQAFGAAWQRTLDRHPALRTGFFWEGLDLPQQVVFRRVELALEQYDLRSVPAAERESRLTAFLEEERQRGFHLSTPPLFRVALFRLGERHWRTVWSYHHIVLDGWSGAIVLGETLAVYGFLKRGEEPRLKPSPPYHAFISWLSRQNSTAAEEAWRRALAGLTGPTLLAGPGEGGAPARAEAQGDLRLQLSAAETSQWVAFGRRHRLTLNTLLQGAWGLLLGRYSGRPDVVYGGVVSGRSVDLPGAESMVGLLINTLPIRVNVEEAAFLLPWLRALQGHQAELYQYGYISLTAIQEWSGLPRDLPLFDTVLAFENFPLPAGPAPGSNLSVRLLDTFSETHYPLVLTVLPGPELLLRLRYDRKRLPPPDAARLFGQLGTLLLAMTESVEARLGDLSLLSPVERHQVLWEWNDSAIPLFPAGGHESLFDLFLAQAERAPDAVAVTCLQEQWSYGEIFRRSDLLGNLLMELGVRTEVQVGLCLERSAGLVVAILAVLKAGGAYVPMDPSYPQERLDLILRDSRAGVLLLAEGRQEGLPEVDSAVPLVTITVTPQGTPLHAQVPRAGWATSPICRESLAYVIYTSGSTGLPKGVGVSHGNVMRLFTSTASSFGFGRGDVWTLFHSYAFDFSVWELWGALLYGGRLVVVPHWVSRSPESFWDLLHREGVTVLSQTPSAFRQLVGLGGESSGELSLRRVIFGGEALEPGMLLPWVERFGSRHPVLVNMYGITETTVHVTYREIGEADCRRPGVSPVGRPLSDLSVYLLDGGGEPVPIGVAGEICVGGPGVSRGYLGRSDLTASRFVPDGFGGLSGGRLYRSGDLARFLPSGDLEYLGRIDGQVKVRGFRIEPGEIESALGHHPGLREAVVIAREEEEGERILVAYVVPREGVSLHAEELREHLRGRLPAYMVPSAFVELASLPLTPSGKLDRRALPAPDRTRGLTDRPFVAPRSEVEAALAEVWAQVLGVDRVGVEDDFFSLGGDSIRSIRMRALAGERSLGFTVQQLFQHPTVAQLAQEIRRFPGETETGPHLQAFGLVSEVDRETFAEEVEDAYPLTALQLGMLFHSEYTPITGIYHDILTAHLRAPFDEAVFCRALGRVLKRHPVLRTSFDLARWSEPLQLVHREVGVQLVVNDWRQLSVADQERRLQAWMEEEKDRSFSWGEPPLWRVRIDRRGDCAFQLSFSFHHAILDGWSVATLLTELLRTYLAPDEDGRWGSAQLLASSYRDFVAIERGALRSEESRHFWREKLGAFEGPVPLTHWPGADGSGILQLQVKPGAAVCGGLTRLASALAVPLKSVLLAVHLRVLAALSGGDQVMTGLVSNGRPEAVDGDRALGLFLNTLPFALRLDDDSWEDLVLRVFAAERELLPHRRFPLMEIQRMLGRGRLFETAFNFVHFHVYQGLAGIEGLDVLASDFFEATDFQFLANFTLDPLSGRLTVWLKLDASQFPSAQLQAIGELYERALAMAAGGPTDRFIGGGLLGEAERHQLLVEWNEGGAIPSAEGTLHERFSAQARQTPEAVALVFDGECLTYGKLDRRSSGLARRLQGLGVSPESRVGVSAERSLGLVIALLGVLKAGGAYVPLDPAYPRERLSLLLADAQIEVLLVDGSAEGSLAEAGALVVRLEDGGKEVEESPRSAASLSASAKSLAYVIYTSGSTGLPKGVGVSHGNVMRLFTSTASSFGFGRGDVWTLFHSYAFDFSVWELWGALLYGGRLVVVPHWVSRSPESFWDLLHREGVTVLSQTPSAFRQLVGLGGESSGELSLRRVIFGGEALEPGMLLPWVERFGSRHPVLVNMYGITETTVHVTYREIGEADCRRPGVSPVGRPLSDLSVYLLDGGGEPVPIGVAGEICVGGPGVSRGYLGRSDLTASRFVPDGFGGLSGGRLYRSGDLARFLPSGDLEYLGRIDGQVKVRGFRIEPGEIESALGHHPGLREAVVIAREEEEGERILVAYVVPREGVSLHAEELREHLRGRLPAYMVPSAFVELASLPLTPSGKLDRRALPAPDRTRGLTDRPFVAPRSEVEAALAEVWAQVLGVDRVGVEDDFFSLGGDSIRSIRMRALAGERGLGFTVQQLFQHPTVAQLAQEIQVVTESPQRPEFRPVASPPRLVVALKEGGEGIPFFCVHPVGGTVFCYSRLAALLKNERPFYGIEAQGLDGSLPPLREVKSMARRYLAEVRAIQVEGPFLLGGWSFGGTVAFEMACQMQELGEEVGLLAILDSRAPSFETAATWISLEADFLAGFGMELGIDPATFGALRSVDGLGSMEERLTAVFEEVLQKRLVPKEIDPLVLRSLFEIYKANLLALNAYRPAVYHGHITLFEASEDRNSNDKSLRGWSAFAKGVKLYQARGGHFGMLREPHVESLAAELRLQLRSVDYALARQPVH